MLRIVLQTMCIHMHIELCTSDREHFIREHKATLLTHTQEVGGRDLQQLLQFARHVLHGGRFFRFLEEHPPFVVARLLLSFFVFGMCLQPCSHVGGCKLVVTY